MTVLVLQTGLFPYAQELSTESFDQYTKADGLSNDNITGIAQDATGFIWLSTLYGLNRYDGTRFVQYHSNTDSFSLVSENLNGMTWLDKERLAIYSNGLHIINTATGEIRNLFVPFHLKQYLYKFNMVTSVKCDEGGNIYVLTRSGFYHFDKNYRLVFRFDYYRENQLNTEHFSFGSKLLVLDNSRLIITSVNGLYEYNKKIQHIKKIGYDEYPLLNEFLDYPNNSCLFYQTRPGSLFVLNKEKRSLYYINLEKKLKTISLHLSKEISDEFAWRSKLIPINDTVFCFTGQHSGFYQLYFLPVTGRVIINPKKILGDYSCNSILKDKENRIWVATNKGLLKQNFQKNKVQSAGLPVQLMNQPPNITLGNVFVFADKIYVGIHGIGGLLIFNKNKFNFQKHIEFNKQNTSGNQVNAIAPVNNSTLLLATTDHILSFNTISENVHRVKPAEWQPGDWTADLLKAKSGNIWTGTSTNVYEYNTTKQRFNLTPGIKKIMMPVRFAEDEKGNIWMASHGIVRYNTHSKQFDIAIDSFPYIKIPDRQINSMVAEDENTLWFNCNDNGLIAYNISNRKFRHFTGKDGLPDNNITSMIIIDKKLWIATYAGIACMDLQTSRIVRFDKEDGFPATPIILGSNFSYDSLSHELYISFYNSVVKFNPEKLLQKVSSPRLFIESVVINGEKRFFLPGKEIKVSRNDNDMLLTIGSINFTDGKAHRFAYRVYKDVKTPWQQLDNRNSFSISNLSPGSHIIQVKCFAANNHWSEKVKDIIITVMPPFWMESWFMILTLLLTILLIYLVVKWRINSVRKMEMEKTNIQKIKADDYKMRFELEQISNYFSSSLSNKKTEDEVLWDVTNNLIREMSYEDCVIYLWNDDKTKMVQKAAYGPKGKPELISANVFEVFPGQGVVGEVMQSQKPVLIDDTRKDSRYRVDDAFRLSEVCVPVIHNNELLGVIDSEHSQVGYFGERDIKILTTIATLIGNKLKQIESEHSLDAKQKELTTINQQLAEARLTALQAQMNPHFVFNALNSIKRMILEGDNEKASRYLSRFAMMIRMTLEQSKETFITLLENIKYLEAYLDMEQLRFNELFSYKINTSPIIDTEETLIPSLMMQPLVENAIWHGLMQSEGEKKISITFTQIHSTITCTIEDNGIGFHHSKKYKKLNGTNHKSVGLENLQNRIKIINEKYHIHCSLKIADLNSIDKNSNGTRAVLKYNIINL